MVRLYNAAHAQRPFTQERRVGWNRLVARATWQPGSQVLVLPAHGALAGYAVLEGRAYGDPVRSVVADELVAEDAAAAALLLSALAGLCWQSRLSEFSVREPADSLVGRVARRMGCSEQRGFRPSGGMMAAVLNRSALVRELEPELRRRAGREQPDLDCDTALAALRRGDLVPDDAVLVRLLLGHWSSGDADAAGAAVPERYRDLCSAWFPGGAPPPCPPRTPTAWTASSGALHRPPTTRLPLEPTGVALGARWDCVFTALPGGGATTRMVNEDR